MRFFLKFILTVFLSSLLFADFSPRITSTLTLVQLDKIQTSYDAGRVAIEGKMLIVGNPYDNDYRGAVYVYIYNDATALYEQVSKITASNSNEQAWFGRSLAIKNGLIVIGAPFTNHGGDARGLVYLVTKPNTGWNDIVCDTYIVSPTENNNDFFGMSIAINSTTLVISAPGDDGYRGSVFVYAKRSAYDWTYKGKLTTEYRHAADDSYHSDAFGYSLAINSSGSTIVVASPQRIRYEHVGAVYVYEKPSSGWANKTEDA